MKTVVFGASENPSRYSNRAVWSLVQNGHEVVALGRKNGAIGGVPIITGQPRIEGVHTVTLYLSESNQLPLQDYILSLKPVRIIFNPGAENPAFEQLAGTQGIETLEACTLVMLSTGQY